MAIPEPLLPEVLRERFQEVKILGEGGCGRVVLAEDRQLSRPVAIKLLLPEGVDSKAFRSRFDREARLTAKIKSPHVAGVYDFDIEGAAPYIVYEFVDGPSLHDVRCRHPGARMPVPEAVRLVKEMLAGLAEIHALGIVHRDVKPRNVQLRDGRTAVVIDLGLGRGEQDTTLTKTGVMLGTPAFMPPDQMVASESSPTWDVYAAALTLFALISGDTPFQGSTYPEVYNAKQEGLIEGLGARGFEVPEALDELLRASLSPDPGERPATAGEMLELLEEACPTPRTVEAPALVPEAPAPPPARPPAPPVVPVLAALALLLGAGAWAFFSPRPARGPEPADLGPEVPARGAPLEELARLRREVESDGEIQNTMGLTGDMDREVALAAWRRGRAAYKTIVRDLGLRALLRRLGTTPLTPEIVGHLSRISLIERLLDRTTLPGEAPLFGPGEETGLGEFLRRVVEVEEEPRLGGLPQKEGWKRRRATYENLLAVGGRRWEAIRSYESMIRPEKPELGPIDETRILNLEDVEFVRSVGKGTSVLIDDFYGTTERERYQVAADHALLDLLPFEGDLYLVCAIHGWGPTVHFWMELLGEDVDPVGFVFTPPPMVGPSKIGDSNVRQGLQFRIGREAIPDGVRRLKVTVRGLQPLGSPKSYAEMGEILQLVKGPPPDAFARRTSGER